VIRLMSVAVLLLLLAGSATSGAWKSGLICTLTGKEITACCCQMKDGKLYCPLAKKTIESCCCKSNGRPSR
jgi:hypothetical protein